ncbi:MAG: disulfide reductase, partial [Chloroflexi bacterium]|nr:disulfide reductase [Chloroflexota bacterium]
CCGAVEYIALEMLPSYALVARNLVLAANQAGNGCQVVAPCSACYLNLRKAVRYMRDDPKLAEGVNMALAAGGLEYKQDSVKVRHLLDVVVNDVGHEQIAEMVTKPLYGLKIAPYYGCLLARPEWYGRNDDPEYPTSMDKLMQILGAEVVEFQARAFCCGGHMTQISERIALEMLYKLLKNATDDEADLIVTICPMCQMNLDAYQGLVNQFYETHFNIPILYFTQMIGLALGMDDAELGFDAEFVNAQAALRKIRSKPPRVKRKKRPSKKELPMPSLLEEV